MYPTSGPEHEYIGYNVVGGTTDALGSTSFKQFLKRVTIEKSGAGCLLVSIDMYVKGNASGVQVLYPVVCDDNAGAPGKMIGGFGAETQAGAIVLSASLSATARWISLPMSMWLTPASYWLMVLGGGSSGFTAHYDSGGSDYTSTGAATWYNNDGGAATNSSRNYSIRGSVVYL